MKKRMLREGLEDVEITSSNPTLKNLLDFEFPDHIRNLVIEDQLKLVSIEGCPSTISGAFTLNNTDVGSLKGGPKHVDKNFRVSGNQLTSLKDSPSYVGGSYYCSHNPLKNFEGITQRIGGSITAQSSNIKSLSGLPSIVKKNLNVGNNDLKNFDGCPSHIEGVFDFRHNKSITSLKGLHKHLKHARVIIMDDCKITSGGIGLILIDGLSTICIDRCGSKFEKAIEIIEKYLGQGRSALIDCQEELMDAGLEEFAEL